MNNQFYQDFAAWIDQWLQRYVGNEPAKLRQMLPTNLMKGVLLCIAINRVFHFINHQCEINQQNETDAWIDIHPQQKTADLFGCERHTVANALKKCTKLLGF